jgi:glycosyltransferase involved in cell wall biosynthesis
LITCIVPVYNNESTLAHVLETLLSCKGIDEIIVIDDCSRDSSPQIIQSFVPAIKAVFNECNLGKGGGVVRGIRLSHADTILMCDADLATLQPHHIECLIRNFKSGDYDMVIGGRETNIGWGHLMSLVSGERIFQRRTIEPYLDNISTRGNGIEQIINYAHNRKKVKIVINHGVGHVLKFNKGGIRTWLPAYTKEVRQLLNTQFYLMKLDVSRRYRFRFDKLFIF